MSPGRTEPSSANVIASQMKGWISIVAMQVKIVSLCFDLKNNIKLTTTPKIVTTATFRYGSAMFATSSFGINGLCISNFVRKYETMFHMLSTVRIANKIKLMIFKLSFLTKVFDYVCINLS